MVKMIVPMFLAVAFFASAGIPISAQVAVSTLNQVEGKEVLELPTPKDPAEEKALKDIDEYGYHVIYVLEEGKLPPFAYSVGIARTAGEAEVVVIGFKQELSHGIINEYNRRVRSGERFKPGERYAGFIEGFDVEARDVHADYYKEYFGWGNWFYRGTDFRVIQLVLPDTVGNWPWEEAASHWFRARQPVLDTSPSELRPES